MSDRAPRPPGAEGLAAFVPPHVLRYLGERDAPPMTGDMVAGPGAVLIADLAGFTALTDELIRRFPDGPERITTALNESLGGLVDLIRDHGGEVVQFEGDAVLAWWPSIGEEAPTAAHRAVACAVLARDQFHGMEIIEGFPLRLRLAVGAGEVRMPIVGGATERWFTFLGGEPLSQALKAEDEARPGEVILSPPTRNLIGNMASGIATAEGSLRAESVDPPEPVSASLPAGVWSEEGLTVFVPKMVRASLAAGQRDWMGELRNGSVMFVTIPGLNVEAGVDKLQAAVHAIQSVVAEHDGDLLKFRLDGTGATAVSSWGLSFHTHEDDASRAVRAAVRVRALIDQQDSQVKIGIATGRLLSTTIGSVNRRELTVIGSIPNLAARLADAARPGQILCEAATAAAARRTARFEELDPIRLKDVAGAVFRYSPIGEKAEQRAGHPSIVGRVRELEVIDDELRTLQDAEPGRALVIEGEAGMGKSRLISELIERSTRHPVRRLTSRGRPLERNTAYYAWRSVFSQLLDLKIEARPEEVRAAVEKVLGPVGDATAALLSPVFPGFEGADRLADSTALTTAAGAPSSTAELLLELFAGVSGPTPTLIVIDDADQMDSASWALAEDLVDSSASLLLVLAVRANVVLSERAAGLLANTTRLQLGPLSPAEAQALVSERLDVDFIPSEVAKAILGRAEGHPLFLEELVAALREGGALRVSGPQRELEFEQQALAELQLSDTVRASVESRIDRLDVNAQLTIKVASVLGRSFDTRELASIHPLSLRPEEIEQHLKKIEEAHLAFRDESGMWFFRNGIFTEVAYDQLPHRQRRSLHEAAAQTIAAGPEDARSDARLAHHWTKADRPAEAMDALERAGDQALRGGAFEEALGYFDEALALRGRETGLSAARLNRKRSMTYQGLGDLPAMDVSLREAAQQVGCPAPASRAGFVLGIIAQVLIQLMHRVWLRPFLVRDRPAEEERLLEAAQMYYGFGSTAFSDLDALRLFYVGLRALNLAERVGPSPILARSYSFLMYVAGVSKMAKSSERYHARAVAAAEAAGSDEALAEVMFNRGGFLGPTGDWEQAISLANEAIDRYDTLGDRRGRRLAVANLAYHHLLQGDLDEARGLYEDIGREAEKAKDLLPLLWSRCWGMSIVALQGGGVVAISELEASAELAAAVGERPGNLLRHAVLAQSHWWEGNVEQAIRSAAEGVEVIPASQIVAAPHALDGYAGLALVMADLWEAATGGRFTADVEQLGMRTQRSCKALNGLARTFPFARSAALLCRARMAGIDGRTTKAVRLGRKALASAEELRMPYYQAQAHALLGHYLTGDEAQKHFDRADQLFDQLDASYLRTELRELRQAIG
ncbi:MAG: AAA family ATPase [Acidimicrobiia bacterium]